MGFYLKKPVTALWPRSFLMSDPLQSAFHVPG